jgi:hypothetical protein
MAESLVKLEVPDGQGAYNLHGGDSNFIHVISQQAHDPLRRMEKTHFFLPFLTASVVGGIRSAEHATPSVR